MDYDQVRKAALALPAHQRRALGLVLDASLDGDPWMDEVQPDLGVSNRQVLLEVAEGVASGYEGPTDAEQMLASFRARRSKP